MLINMYLAVTGKQPAIAFSLTANANHSGSPDTVLLDVVWHLK